MRWLYSHMKHGIVRRKKAALNDFMVDNVSAKIFGREIHSLERLETGHFVLERLLY